MSKFIDLTGQKFHKLTVLERAQNSKRGRTRWKCKCDCGNITVVEGANLKNGAVKSCGCLLHRTKESNRKNNMRLYRIWNGIKSRCNCVTSPAYKNYGGRYITVCKEWENFDNFMEWAIQSGYTEKLTIERIDVNGNYEPNNCKWIPLSEQSNNRRSNKLFTFQNTTQNLQQWCTEYNLDYKRVHNRIFKLGWSFEKALFTPVDVNKRNMETRKKCQNT